jgi:hypothetical protein
VNLGVRRKEPSIPSDPLSEVAFLSLTARLAVALHLLAGYCRRRGIDHPELDRYIEHMWGFAALPGGGEGFEEWEFSHPALVDAGLGYEYPEGFEACLAASGVSGPEFRAALMHTTEVLYGSLWAAADNAGSLRDVKGLAAIALAAGAAWPDLSAFAESRWVGGGWGGRLSPEQVARWRSAG